MLARYLHTARYLRPSQVAGRLWFRLYRPRPDLTAAPPARAMAGLYVTPVRPDPTLVAPEVFRFLNVERSCTSAIDWQPAQTAKLWTYHLHYFDDLNARDASVRAPWHRRLLERWVTENPPGRGDGWEPYPVSRRIVNWVKWAASGNALSGTCHASLAVQARWLMRRLEYHILGNHLFANAKALVHAGLYFDGDEAAQWYAIGLRLVDRELREQILTDGGHFELSTMYHAMFLEDMLDLVNILRAYGQRPPTSWFPAISRMRPWLHVMTHPDGEISFFNDAAFGVAPNAAEVDAYAARLALSDVAPAEGPVTALESSGYLRLVAGAAQVLCDCAAVGPDYLPGHAHADSLSFEMSLFGHRVFVNSGTSVYGTDAERQRQRGTAAHNTVVVNGEDSSEVWGGFRVARRARTTLHRVTSTLPATVEASHDGYRRLRGRNKHRRRWILDTRSLQIMDHVSGSFRTAEAVFHFHPQIEVRASDLRGVILTLPGSMTARIVFENAASVEIRPGTWHPKFGVSVPNHFLAVRFSGASLQTRMEWTQAQ
jgi:uncharacterized heparinase superfamily protein